MAQNTNNDYDQIIPLVYMNENYGQLEVSSQAMMYLESIPWNKKLTVVILTG